MQSLSFESCSMLSRTCAMNGGTRYNLAHRQRTDEQGPASSPFPSLTHRSYAPAQELPFSFASWKSTWRPAAGGQERAGSASRGGSGRGGSRLRSEAHRWGRTAGGKDGQLPRLVMHSAQRRARASAHLHERELLLGRPGSASDVCKARADAAGEQGCCQKSPGTKAKPSRATKSLRG